MNVFFLQIDTTQVIGNQVFGINPTTVYGVLSTLLFSAVLVLGKFYQDTIKKSLLDKDTDIARLNKVIDNLASDKDSLHKTLNDITANNIKTLSNFEQSINLLTKNQTEQQQRFLETLKEISQLIRNLDKK
jgi:uncharacterized UPF0160 family protein